MREVFLIAPLTFRIGPQKLLACKLRDGLPSGPSDETV